MLKNKTKKKNQIGYEVQVSYKGPYIIRDINRLSHAVILVNSSGKVINGNHTLADIKEYAEPNVRNNTGEEVEG